MADGKSRLLPEDIPEARSVPRRGRAFPWFWIVPLVAILIGVVMMIKAVIDQGPTIQIHFKNAEGIDANKTHIKYKSVDIGVVKAIRLDSDNKSVIVEAEMTHDASKLLVSDTRFWVVRPRIAGGQISGLATLVSGSYIAMDVGSATKARREFVGLEQAPTVTTDEPGSEFILHSETLGSLDVGSPVYFRRAQVGQVTSAELDPDGRGVTLKVFVHSPYEHFVTANARFWHASGVDLSLDANGIKLQTQSVVAILLGGIAFLAPPDLPAGPAMPPDSAFTLFENQARAMRRTDSEAMTIMAYFTGSVRGLQAGAPVEFRGLAIGEVKSIDVVFDPDHMDFRFPVELSVYPDRLLPKRGPMPVPTEEGDTIVMRAIAKGLRAQITSGNLLTGQKYVSLDFFPKAPRVKVDTTQLPYVIPTVNGSLDDLQATLADIAQKIDKIPFAEIASDLRTTLKTLNQTLSSADSAIHHIDTQVTPQIQATLDSAHQTLNAAKELLESDAPVQQDLREALQQLTRTAESIRVLTDYIQQHPESFIRGKPSDAKENAP